MSIKPALAKDAVLDKVMYPCWFQPKIDGVRGLNLTGTFTGRSLDPFEGFGITEYFSQPEFIGFDGEMTLGDKPNSAERLCSLTSGAMGRFKGVTEMANLHWWLFDLVREDTIILPYEERYYLLRDKFNQLEHSRLHLVSYKECYDRDMLDFFIGQAYDDNYEGGIIRNPRAVYKPDRPTKLQELWRVKAWQEDEALCTGITEGERNENEAKTNSLGRTERSSAKAGKVPNGMVGSLQATLIKDIVSNITGKKLFPKGHPVTIAPGEMTDAEAKDFFEHPEKIVGKIIKFKHLAHGTLDQPRMGTYRSLRLPQDM